MNTKTLVGHKIPSALIEEAAVLAPLAVDGMDAMALVQANVAVAQAVVEAFQALRETRAAQEARMLRLQLEAARVSAEVAQRSAQRWQETAQLAERAAGGQTTVRRALRRVG